jgi:preprotein translocase subunit SecG
MYTTIGIFYFSLILIIVMILLKRAEVKSGHPSIISRLGRGSDQFFHTIFSAVGNAASYLNKHTFVALGHWIAFHILVRVRKVYVEIKASFLAMPQGKKMLDAVRGRGEVKDHGASFYLRRISDK